MPALNPQGLPGVGRTSPSTRPSAFRHQHELAVLRAEVTMSYLTQMLGLTVHNSSRRRPALRSPLP